MGLEVTEYITTFLAGLCIEGTAVTEADRLPLDTSSPSV